jgi:hypothetical protein
VAWALLLGNALACAPGNASGQRDDGEVLYVASAPDGTVARHDPQSGRMLGVSLPGGSGPTRVLAGEGGLLTLALGAPSYGLLTHVAPRGGGWAARPVPLEPGARAAAAATDGGPRAAVVYHPGNDDARAAMQVPPPGLCRLAIVDTRTGAPVRTGPLCATGEVVQSDALAVETGRGASGTVYVGLWRPQEGAGGRVLAIDLSTGTVTAAARLAGVPGALRLIPAAAGGGPSGALYCIETLSADTSGNGDTWRLLRLRGDTLEVEGAAPLQWGLVAPAVSPEGATLYALAAPVSLLRSVVVQVDPDSGQAHVVATLPGLAYGLAVTRDRVFVPEASGDRLWVLDRRGSGTLPPRTVPTSRGAVGLALGPPLE